MIFGLFSKRARAPDPVEALFARVAEASRQPWLYSRAGIPDSFEGRFESLALHAFIVLRRLRELPAPAGDVAQEFVDACFAYLELGFRQAGVSDIGVPKKMKKIAQSFYGRVQAYDAALDADPDGRAGLVEALRRNAAPGEGAVALADYVVSAGRAFAGRDLEVILGEAAPFPALARGEPEP